MKFSEAEKLFKRAKRPWFGYRLPGREGSTRLVKVSDTSYGIKLHQTVVVEIHKDGTYTIDTGGWYTKTTRDRIHSYSPVSLTSCNGAWYVWDRQTQTLCARVDGVPLTVNAAGVPVDKHRRVASAVLEAEVKTERNRRARIRRAERKIAERIQRSGYQLTHEAANTAIAGVLYD